MKYLIQNAFANNTEFSFQLGQLIFESSGSTNLIQDTIDVPCTKKAFNQHLQSAPQFTFCDLFPSLISKVPSDKRICVIRLHPDVSFLYNHIFTQTWMTENYSLQVYLKQVNYEPLYFDLETKKSNLPFNLDLLKLTMPMLQTSEDEFLEYQDYMKHLPIEDHPELQEESTYISINGKQYFNAYDVLGYIPMRFDDLQELQDTCI